MKSYSCGVSVKPNVGTGKDYRITAGSLFNSVYNKVVPNVARMYESNYSPKVKQEVNQQSASQRNNILNGNSSNSGTVSTAGTISNVSSNIGSSSYSSGSTVHVGNFGSSSYSSGSTVNFGNFGGSSYSSGSTVHVGNSGSSTSIGKGGENVVTKLYGVASNEIGNSVKKKYDDIIEKAKIPVNNTNKNIGGVTQNSAVKNPVIPSNNSESRTATSTMNSGYYSKDNNDGIMATLASKNNSNQSGNLDKFSISKDNASKLATSMTKLGDKIINSAKDKFNSNSNTGGQISSSNAGVWTQSVNNSATVSNSQSSTSPKTMTTVSSHQNVPETESSSVNGWSTQNINGNTVAVYNKNGNQITADKFSIISNDNGIYYQAYDKSGNTIGDRIAVKELYRGENGKEYEVINPITGKEITISVEGNSTKARRYDNYFDKVMQSDGVLLDDNSDYTGTTNGPYGDTINWVNGVPNYDHVTPVNVNTNPSNFLNYAGTTNGPYGDTINWVNGVPNYDTVGTAYPSYYGNTGVQSPYGNSGVQSPYGNSGVQSPYANTGVQSPYANTGVQSPYGNTGVQSPYGNVGMQSPYANTGVQSPYGNTGVQSPFNDSMMSFDGGQVYQNINNLAQANLQYTQPQNYSLDMNQVYQDASHYWSEQGSNGNNGIF